jgi:hypothetical protein
LLAITCPEAPAASLPRPTAAASPAVASPGSTLIAALAADGILEVRRPGSQRVRYAIPSGCNPTAVAPGVVFVCTPPQAGPQELNLTSGMLSPLNLMQTFAVTRAGTRWLEGVADEGRPAIVSRTSGEVIELEGPRSLAWGSRRYIDLSSVNPARALCTPLRRARAGTTRRQPFYALEKVGSWTLTTREAGRSSVQVLQRCGSPDTLRLASGSSPILGRGAAAWFDRRNIRVRDLASGRTRTYAWFRGAFGRPTLAFSANRLVVSVPALAGGKPYYRIHLIAV